jgi:hypothetical protein
MQNTTSPANPVPRLFTATQRRKLVANWHRDEPTKPVVKLFTPDGAGTWLLSGVSPNGMFGYGLCDLGLGFPELGYVSIQELMEIRGAFGLPVERDRWFTAKKSLSDYLADAERERRIIT